MYVFLRNVIKLFRAQKYVNVMKQYKGVREDANGTRHIPVNSNTAIFVAP